MAMSFWIGGRAKILRRGGGAQYHFFIFIRPAEQNIINVFHNKVIFEIDVIKKMLITKMGQKHSDESCIKN